MYNIMGCRAQSKTKKQQLLSDLKDTWTDIAAARYIEERKRDIGNGSAKRQGLRPIIQEVQLDCFHETKQRIKLSKTTVKAWINGRPSIKEFNC